MDSYEVNEISSDPGGLKYRWLIKGMIPLSFMILTYLREAILGYYSVKGNYFNYSYYQGY